MSMGIIGILYGTSDRAVAAVWGDCQARRTWRRRSQEATASAFREGPLEQRVGGACVDIVGAVERGVLPLQASPHEDLGNRWRRSGLKRCGRRKRCKLADGDARLGF